MQASRKGNADSEMYLDPWPSPAGLLVLSAGHAVCCALDPGRPLGNPSNRATLRPPGAARVLVSDGSDGGASGIYVYG